MSTTNDSGFRAFTATAVAIPKATRVTLDSSGNMLASGAAADSIGVTLDDVVLSGVGVVKLWSAPGTWFVTASAAITNGAPLFPTASGKVDDAGTAGTGLRLCALGAATADGDIIEAGPMAAPMSPTLADGDNFVLGTSTGSKIGTATNQKLGFYNATPIVQRVGAAQDAIVTTAVSLGGNIYGYTTSAQATAIITLSNELRASLVALGLIKGAA